MPKAETLNKGSLHLIIYYNKVSTKNKQMKLLALDIDGTLVNSQHQVTTPVRDALLEAQRTRNLCIILASGRPTAALRQLVQLLELERYGGYLLPYNGGKAIELSTGHTLHAQLLSQDLLPQIDHLIKSHDVDVLSYTEENILIETAANEYAQKEIDITGMSLKVLPDFMNTFTEPLPKCLAVGPTEKLIRLEAALKHELGQYIDAFRSSDIFLEIVPLGVNKGTALASLLKILGKTSKDLIAIGDNYNDVEMLRLAETSIAMGNAPKDIQQLATFVTKTNNEDGVAYALEHFLFPS